MAAMITFDLLAKLQARKEELEVFLAPHLQELDEINSAIASLSGDGVRYNWNELAIKTLTKFDCLLQTNEILERAVGGGFKNADEKKRKNMSVALSIALSNMCETGILGKVVVRGVKGHFYGLEAWFKDGNLLGKYDNELKKRINIKTSLLPVFWDKPKA